MSKQLALQNRRPATENNPEVWIQDGWQMARHEGETVLESIELKHEAECKAYGAIENNLNTQGSAIHDRSNELGWWRFSAKKLTTGNGDLSPGLECGRISAGNAPECARFTNIATGDTIGSAID